LGLVEFEVKALVLVETASSAAAVAAWGFAGSPVVSAALAAGLVDSVALAFVEPAAAVVPAIFAVFVVDFVGHVEFAAFEQATLYFH